MSTFTYFAYGSNMLTSRLVARCPSAKAIGLAYADGYALSFSKLSTDKSGKGNLVISESARAYGVLFTIDDRDKADLDRFEGRDYSCRSDFNVIQIGDGTPITATTYLAKEQVDNLEPYEWYAALILAGATEHRLLDHAPTFLHGLTWADDPSPERDRRLEALNLLKAAGVTNPLQFLQDHQLRRPKAI